MKNSQKFKHPDFPKRKDMIMYRVLLSMIDGQASRSQGYTDITTGGKIDDPGAASLLMEGYDNLSELKLTVYTVFVTPPERGALGSLPSRKPTVGLWPHHFSLPTILGCLLYSSDDINFGEKVRFLKVERPSGLQHSSQTAYYIYIQAL